MNNPYAVSPSSYQSSDVDGPRRMSLGPIDALSRGYQLLGEQYMLAVGVCFVGLLIAQLVPFGILTGPMLVGIFFCMIEREQGRKFDFNTLFRGFERFVDSLVAMIVMIITNLVLVGPLVIIYLVVIFSSIDRRGEPNLGIFIGGTFIFWICIIFASLLTYLPFSFCYQLIADRKMTALDSIKLSMRAAWLNLGPLLAFGFVGALISFVLTLMCYVPVIFFIPVWFAGTFVVYREIFPESVVNAQINDQL